MSGDILLSQVGGYYWHIVGGGDWQLVGRGQGYYYTFYNLQGSPSPQRHLAQMSTLLMLRNPVAFILYSFKLGTFSFSKYVQVVGGDLTLSPMACPMAGLDGEPQSK